MSKESIWDLAVKKNRASANDFGERTLILAGSKSSGKTKMIQRFLDHNDPIKETLAMEYSFGRKSGRSLSKDICHVWELGGGVLFTDLLNVHIGKNNNTTLVLVLDLSSPETLWHVLETILQSVYNMLKKKELSGEFEPCGNKIDENYKDYEHISPFPMPLVIVGGKYDLFEGFEPEKRKVICRTLRQVAHSLAASLIFYSDKDSTLVKKLKDVFHHHGFGGSLWKGYCTDYNKPLMIPFGADSFEQMDVNTKSWPLKNRGLLLDRFKHAYTSLFPQDTGSEDLNIPDDPAINPNFREPIIDLLQTQKYETKAIRVRSFCREPSCDQVEKVTLFPPDEKKEESGDEDDTKLDHLTGRLLRSEVEVRLVSSNNNKEFAENKKYTRLAPKLNLKGVFGVADEEEKNITCCEEKSPTEWFKSLFTEDILLMIVKMSNLYAIQRNHTSDFSMEELRVYIAVYWLSATKTYIHVLGKPAGYSPVAKAIRQNRFREIHKYLHLCDNLNLPKNDKFAKTIEYFNKQFI